MAPTDRVVEQGCLVELTGGDESVGQAQASFGRSSSRAPARQVPAQPADAELRFSVTDQGARHQQHGRAAQQAVLGDPGGETGGGGELAGLEGADSGVVSGVVGEQG